MMSGKAFRQTALLARVYYLELAVCFARAIRQALRVPVRDGAIWASEDDAGRRLQATFHEGLQEHGVPVDVALDGKPLRDFVPAEVADAAQAASLADCEAFLWFALGSTSRRLHGEILAPIPA